MTLAAGPSFKKTAEFSFQNMWSAPERKFYFDIMA